MPERHGSPPLGTIRSLVCPLCTERNKKPTRRRHEYGERRAARQIDRFWECTACRHKTPATDTDLNLTDPTSVSHTTRKVAAEGDPLNATRRERLLAELADHPAGLACENLLAAVCRPGERELMLSTLRQLRAAGVISITGKSAQNRISGALIQLVRPSANRDLP